MILVLGGGFGLYGHAAALAEMGAPVATLRRYRSEAQARPELAALIDRIIWIADEDAALREAGTTVLARRPADNEALARRLMLSGAGGDLVIEKPIAPEPGAADRLASGLAGRGRRWATPYLFGHTDWGSALREAVARGEAARIDWVHRTGDGWKGDAAAGGGIIAFYLIHALALIADALPDAVLTARNDADGAVEIVADDRLTVRFACAAEPGFAAQWGASGRYRAKSPFGEMPARGAPDPRIEPLRRFYRTIFASWSAPPPAFHAAVGRHWRTLARLL